MKKHSQNDEAESLPVVGLLALAMISTPVAFSLGMPAGTWLGNLLGWRLSFALMSGLSVTLIARIILVVPYFPGQAVGQKMRLTRALLIPGIRPIPVGVLTWMLAHNILYSYIPPFLPQAGLSSSVDIVLLVFGLAAMAGIFITCRVTGPRLRIVVLLSLAVFALSPVISGISATSPAVIYPGITARGLTFGGAATLLQTTLSETAGEHADITLSMNVLTWTPGDHTGGLLLRHAGVHAFPRVLLALLIVALLIAFGAKNHGFPSGPAGHNFYPPITGPWSGVIYSPTSS